MSSDLDGRRSPQGGGGGGTAAPRQALTATDFTCLFTYKVANDAGTAPNPYFGVCTLALGKARIRQHAEPGDLVVGFGCRSPADPDEEFRVIYAMQVEEVLTWPSYITRCRLGLRGKIPEASSPERYAGDCIYRLEGGQVAREPLPSGSGHDSSSYQNDVEAGKNVLTARRYWYFGAGDRHRLVVTQALRELSPPGQGFRSKRNALLITTFVGWFNEQVSRLALAPGVHGSPTDSIAAPRAGADREADGGAVAAPG